MKNFLTIAIQAHPYLEKGIQANYRAEIESLVTRSLYSLFERIVEDQKLYESYTRSDVRLIIRYHCQAILGILREWNDADTKEIDHIVHLIYQMLTGQCTPF